MIELIDINKNNNHLQEFDLFFYFSGILRLWLVVCVELKSYKLGTFPYADSTVESLDYEPDRLPLLNLEFLKIFCQLYIYCWVGADI